jgi:CHAD domain-containing protein
LRREAGATRDWDVFLLALRERLQRVEDGEHPGLDFLVGYALGQRGPVLAELQTTAGGELEAFEGFIADTVAALRAAQDQADDSTLLDLARPMMAGLRQNLEEKVAGDLNDYPQLHQVRIAGKRLRYAMEVFADCFGESFRQELYPQIEEMQELLGRANDSHVASGRLGALRDWLKAQLPEEWKRLQPGVEGLLRFHQRRLPQERRRFLRWWEQWSKSGSEELLTTLFATAPQG